jgi:hypothetical protein
LTDARGWVRKTSIWGVKADEIDRVTSRPERRLKAGDCTAGLASVLVAGVLVALKLWAISETGALSIAASLTDSALDLMMSLGAAVAIVYAASPADEDHAFGHSARSRIWWRWRRRCSS